MKTNNFKVWLYHYQKTIPNIKNAQDVCAKLADVIQKEFNLAVGITPIAVGALPFHEDARLIFECGKCRGKINNVVSALNAILQNDQLSTESYKISVRFEEEFGQKQGFFGLFGNNYDETKEVYIDGRFIKNYRKNPLHKVIVFRTSVVPEAIRNVDRDLARNLDLYPFFICEMDQKDALVQFDFARDVSKEVAAHLEQGNGAVVYEN